MLVHFFSLALSPLDRTRFLFEIVLSIVGEVLLSSNADINFSLIDYEEDLKQSNSPVHALLLCGDPKNIASVFIGEKEKSVMIIVAFDTVVEGLGVEFMVKVLSWMDVIMDKSWIDIPRNTVKYLDGLNKFLDISIENRSINGAIRCPCSKCHCNKWESRDVVHDHLICKRFPKNYKVWIWHGEAYETMASRNTKAIVEPLQNGNPVLSMINDTFGINRLHDVEPDSYEGPYEFVDNMPNEENEEIGDLCLCGVTNKAMTMIFE
ncbi:hypothetical protein CR513_31867, partial [Mucuna pruriens]